MSQFMTVEIKYPCEPIESVHDFLNILESQSSETQEHGRTLSAHENYLGGTYLRGEGRDNWPLLPTIGRCYHYAEKKIEGFGKNQEQLLLNRFRRQSYSHFNRELKPWEALFIARHYGLPVRILDWTSNPLVALYWACQREVKDNGAESDGVVWFISRRPPPEEFLDILLPENQDPFQITGIRTVVPYYIDARLSAQASIFTIHGDPKRPMDEVLKAGLPEADCDIKAGLRWTVPQAQKKSILVELEKMGVNARTLIPDLHGLCLGLWRTEVIRATGSF